MKFSEQYLQLIDSLIFQIVSFAALAVFIVTTSRTQKRTDDKFKSRMK